mmetsp:Transcript_12267/g.26216  ORF Transcript_12267/g.26216 Transcript_12267/m.26216 type:complete len:370 (-) Transcript_12267:203-1312(-)
MHATRPTSRSPRRATMSSACGTRREKHATRRPSPRAARRCHQPGRRRRRRPVRQFHPVDTRRHLRRFRRFRRRRRRHRLASSSCLRPSLRRSRRRRRRPSPSRRPRRRTGRQSRRRTRTAFPCGRAPPPTGSAARRPSTSSFCPRLSQSSSDGPSSSSPLPPSSSSTRCSTHAAPFAAQFARASPGSGEAATARRPREAGRPPCQRRRARLRRAARAAAAAQPSPRPRLARVAALAAAAAATAAAAAATTWRAARRRAAQCSPGRQCRSTRTTRRAPTSAPRRPSWWPWVSRTWRPPRRCGARRATWSPRSTCSPRRRRANARPHPPSLAGSDHSRRAPHDDACREDSSSVFEFCGMSVKATYPCTRAR